MTLRPSFRPDDAEREHEYEETLTVPLNYGGYHPFEIMEEDRIRRRSSRLRDRDLKKDSGNSNSNSDTSSSEETFRTASSRDYEPIRIVLKLHGLDDTTMEANGDGEEERDENGSNQQPLAESSNGGSGTGSASSRSARISYLKELALPSAALFWSSALRVYPPASPIIVRDNRCMDVSDDERGVSVPDADLVVYVFADRADLCVRQDGLTSMAGASSCQRDQYGRPTVGLIIVCLDAVVISTRDYSESSSSGGSPAAADRRRDAFTDTLVHEFAHMLGFHYRDFSHYRDHRTGLRRTIDRTPDP